MATESDSAESSSRVELAISSEQFERIALAAKIVGVTIEEFIVDAVEEECYLTLGDEESDV